MSFIDYYSILGISHKATQEEISIAFKAMAKKWHPDTSKSINSTQQMQLISEAYAILKDSEKRKLYNFEYNNHFYKSTYSQTPVNNNKENCHFCDKNKANSSCSKQVALYKITEITHFPRKKVKYNVTDIKIPRCEECYKIHSVRGMIFLVLPFFSFAILGAILGLTIWKMWLVFLLIGAVIGAIIGGVLISIDSYIIAKEAGIKKETDINEYEEVISMMKQGWSTEQPNV